LYINFLNIILINNFECAKIIKKNVFVTLDFSILEWNAEKNLLLEKMCLKCAIFFKIFWRDRYLYYYFLSLRLILKLGGVTCFLWINH